MPCVENGETTGYMVFCPACKCGHLFNTKAGNPNGVGGHKPTWQFVNNDVEKPTFRASMLVKCGHFADGKSPKDCWLCKRVAAGERDFSPCSLCHSFVTDGKIQFLNDCSHALKGQTVDLPDWDDLNKTANGG
jgi:hypothetical protein